MHIKKRSSESVSSMLYRFNKRIKRSGVLKEARKRRFNDRSASKRKRLISALHREKKKKEFAKKRKLGIK